jgi:hypothetical protein
MQRLYWDLAAATKSDVITTFCEKLITCVWKKQAEWENFLVGKGRA